MARRIAVASAVLCALVLALPAVAQARTSHDYVFHYDQVWSASLRMVRVDLGYAVRDRDPDVGYLLFDYQEGHHSYPASIELVRTHDDGRDVVRVVVKVPAMPSYIEQMMIDRLTRKLHDDFGAPPPPPPRHPAAGAHHDQDHGTQDGDADHGNDDGDQGGHGASHGHRAAHHRDGNDSEHSDSHAG